MYFQVNLCCLCLSCVKNDFKNLYEFSEDEITYFEKLCISFPQLITPERSTLLDYKLCSKCSLDLDNFYNFFLKCSRSITTFEDYKRKLKLGRPNKTHVEININIIKLTESEINKYQKSQNVEEYISIENFSEQSENSSDKFLIENKEENELNSNFFGPGGINIILELSDDDDCQIVDDSPDFLSDDDLEPFNQNIKNETNYNDSNENNKVNTDNIDEINEDNGVYDENATQNETEIPNGFEQVDIIDADHLNNVNNEENGNNKAGCDTETQDSLDIIFLDNGNSLNINDQNINENEGKDSNNIRKTTQKVDPLNNDNNINNETKTNNLSENNDETQSENNHYDSETENTESPEEFLEDNPCNNETNTNNTNVNNEVDTRNEVSINNEKNSNDNNENDELEIEEILTLLNPETEKTLAQMFLETDPFSKANGNNTNDKNVPQTPEKVKEPTQTNLSEHETSEFSHLPNFDYTNTSQDKETMAENFIENDYFDDFEHEEFDEMKPQNLVFEEESFHIKSEPIDTYYDPLLIDPNCRVKNENFSDHEDYGYSNYSRNEDPSQLEAPSQDSKLNLDLLKSRISDVLVNFNKNDKKIVESNFNDHIVKIHACKYCNKKFEYKTELKKHIKTNHDKNFISKDLKVSESHFLKNRDYIETSSKRKNKTNIVCLKCSKKFSKLLNYKIHICATKINGRYYCKYCSDHFAKLYAYRAHELKHFPTKEYKCRYCLQIFYRENYLIRHEIQHEKNIQEDDSINRVGNIKEEKFPDYPVRTKQLKCRYCPEKFNRKNFLIRHELTHNVLEGNGRPKKDALNQKSNITEDKEFKCQFCPRVFRFKKFLMRHEQYHRKEEMGLTTEEPMRAGPMGVGPMEAGPTKETRSKKAEPIMHKITNENNNFTPDNPENDSVILKYCCDICSKTFESKTHLYFHKLGHKKVTKANDLTCKYCLKVFSKRTTFIAHIKKHPKKHELMKCLDCNLKFKDRKHLMEHKWRRHLKFTCEICSLKFFSVSLLQTHKNEMHKDKTNSTNDKNHENKNEKGEYLCKFCDKSYPSHQGLKMHENWHVKRHKITQIMSRKTKETKNKKSEENLEETSSVNKNEFKCKYCEKILPTHHGWICHEKWHIKRKNLLIKRLQNNSDLSCKYCYKNFRTRNSRILHEKIHKNEKYYTCEICKEEFSNLDSFISHKMAHNDKKIDEESKSGSVVHETGSFAQKSGSFAIKSGSLAQKSGFFVHKSGSVPKSGSFVPKADSNDCKNFICRFCNKIMKTRAGLTNHEKLHKRMKIFKRDPLQCRYCPNFFLSVRATATHEKTHEVNDQHKNYCCKICKKIFLNRRSLFLHKKTHVVEKKINGDSPKKEENQIPSSRPCQDTTSNNFFKLKDFLNETDNEKSSETKTDEIICNICSKSFTNRKSLFLHKKLHKKLLNGQNEPKDLQYPCRFCSELFTNRRSLFLHKKNHKKSGDSPLTEKIKEVINANLKYRNEKTLGKSNDDRLNEEIFPCEFCSEIFTNRRSLCLHKKTHSKSKKVTPLPLESPDNEPNVFSCKLCKQTFTNRRSLFLHCKTHERAPKSTTSINTNVETQFSCNECPKVFTNHRSLFLHRKTHGSLKKHVEMVKSVSGTVDNFSKDVVDQFSCEECSKVFTNRRSLFLHRKAHKSQKQLISNTNGICDEGNQELNSTQNDKTAKLSCNKCKLNFSTKSTLIAHIKAHETKQLRHCKNCKLTFVTKASYLVHKKAHDLKNPLICKICNRYFGSNHALVQHQYIHEGLRFKCFECDQICPRPQVLRDHLLKKHNIDKNVESIKVYGIKINDNNTNNKIGGSKNEFDNSISGFDSSKKKSNSSKNSFDSTKGGSTSKRVSDGSRKIKRSKSGPGGFKSGSDGSKSGPDSSKSGPDGSKSGQDGSKNEPDGYKSGPDGSKSGPDGFKSGLGGSKSGPDGCKSRPDSSKSKTDGSKSGQDGSKSEPDGSKSGLDGSKSGSDGSKSGQEGSKSGQDGFKSRPDNSKSGTNGSKSGPDGSKSGPDGSKSGPDGSKSGQDSFKSGYDSKSILDGSISGLDGSKKFDSSKRKSDNLKNDFDDSKSGVDESKIFDGSKNEVNNPSTECDSSENGWNGSNSSRNESITSKKFNNTKNWLDKFKFSLRRSTSESERSETGSISSKSEISNSSSSKTESINSKSENIKTINCNLCETEHNYSDNSELLYNCDICDEIFYCFPKAMEHRKSHDEQNDVESQTMDTDKK